MRKIAIIFIFVFLAGLAGSPFEASAKLGVGVGTGKIELDKSLKPGGLYTLPPLTVINTGDEPSEYGVSVEYKSDQPRKSPPKEWVAFNPETFYLEPGQSQVVEVKINVPIKAEPGDYFAYLEGHPSRRSSSAGGATVGIGAAAKLLFVVAPANIFQAVYYRVGALLKNNAPWSYVISAMFLASLIVALFRKYFSFSIGINRKAE